MQWPLDRETAGHWGFVLQSWKVIVGLSFTVGLQNTRSNQPSKDYSKLIKKLWKQVEEIEMDN